MKYLKSIGISVTIASVLTLTGTYLYSWMKPVSVVAAGSQCSHSCYFTVGLGGYVYDVTTTAQYKCSRGWPSWGCNLLQSEAMQRLSPTSLSGSWHLSCGNTHSYSATIVSSPEVTTCGCGIGEYFCVASGSCVNEANVCQ